MSTLKAVKNLALFIPTYNVEKNVGQVLGSIPPGILDRFRKTYVIDNGSGDRSLEVVKSYAAGLAPELRGRFEIYRNSENYSLGGSTQVALGKAIDDGMDYLVCMHSDGQANPADLKKFLDVFDEGDYDFVLGSRFLGESRVSHYSKIRYAGNLFFTYLQQTLLRQKVYDLGAFVAFNLKTVGALPFHTLPGDMGYHPHLILSSSQWLKRKLRMREFPIEWGRVEHSNVNVIAYGLVHLYRIFRLFLKRPAVQSVPKRHLTERVHFAPSI